VTYTPRRLGLEIKTYASQYPVVAIVGPRQSGKSTLARALFPDYPYITLESLDHRRRALNDPRLFLRNIGPQAVLDEAQRAPELFSYLQEYVDQPDTGRHYVLTGSHQFLLMESVTQSLAGRVATFRLFPFTLTELPELRERPTVDLLCSGFYPRIHQHELDPVTWYANYVETYLERDVRQIVNVADIHQFEVFLRIVAGQSGQVLNKASVANRVGVSQPTVARWLSVLESSGITARIPPFHRNLSKRLTKSPKLFFLDSGLLCFLLDIHTPSELSTHPLYGSIFESFVVAEIFKRINHAGARARLSFWRDQTGREIDLIIEDGPRLLPVEIKSAATWTPDFARTLRWWLDLPGNTATEGLVVYDGDTDLSVDAEITCRSWRRMELFT
jgi:predicted AAA+ superfamily ATPase